MRLFPTASKSEPRPYCTSDLFDVDTPFTVDTTTTTLSQQPVSPYMSGSSSSSSSRSSSSDSSMSRRSCSSRESRHSASSGVDMVSDKKAGVLVYNGLTSVAVVESDDENEEEQHPSSSMRVLTATHRARNQRPGATMMRLAYLPFPRTFGAS